MPGCPEGVDAQTWADWLKLRKARRAAVTATVVLGAIREAEKAGMTLNDFLVEWCLRGSQGLKAEWLAGRAQGAARVAGQPSAKSFAQQEREAGMRRWEEMTGREHPELAAMRGADALVVDVPARCAAPAGLLGVAA